MIHHVTPISVLHLFPVLEHHLISLLRTLNEAEWEQRIATGKYSVKDTVAHILDNTLRTLSLIRDDYRMGRPEEIKSYFDLVSYLDRLDEEWITAAQRLSPNIITDLLEVTGKEYFEVLNGLDPWEDSVFSESLAGEEIAKNWFHIAREYADRWTYQQQIRNALGKEELLTRELFYPVIDTYMCALPQTYRYTDAVVGSSVMIRVTGDAGGEWHINKTEEGWVLRHTTRVEPLAVVEMDAGTAWRLFSKEISPEKAEERVKLAGAAELGKIALQLTSVIV